MALQNGVRQRRRRGLAARLTRAFASLACALLLVVGLVLVLVSYRAQLGQITLQQQKTAGEAAVLSASYLNQARLTLSVYGQTGSLQGLLLQSMQAQRQQLRAILDRHGEMLEELTLVDNRGQELARVTRDYIFSIEDLHSQAGTPAFEAAIQGKEYVASETEIPAHAGFPEVAIAVPLTGRDNPGVLIGGVSMKGLWDAVAQVEVGETGYAYIVNAHTGAIVAHSRYNRYLALQGQTLEQVPIVHQIMAGDTDIQHQYRGLEGAQVLGAATPLPGTDWQLIVELPTREALAGVRQMLLLLGVLTVCGGLAAGSLGLILPRRIVQPLLALQEGAQQLGAGRLDHVIEVNTGDEIQDVAEAFNQMAASLRTSLDELDRWGHELEGRVEDRTRELAQTTEQMRRRAVQLQTSGEVAHAITSVQDLDLLLPEVAGLISQRFGWYHVGIFLLDEDGRFAVLRAANSVGGQQMLARGHRLRVGAEGIVGRVTATGEPRIALDVGADAVYFDNPALPDTRSEMALPLRVEGRVIGALDVQSTEEAAYDNEDVALLTTLADQVAVAISNALFFAQTQNALDEVRRVQRQYVQREWAGVTARESDLAYDYRRIGAPSLAEPTPPEAKMALARGEIVAFADRAAELATADGGNGQGDAPVRAALAAPIKLRDQIIGVLDLQVADEPRHWTDDEVAMVGAISDQVALALENARLLEAEQEQRMAAEALREAAVVLSSTLEFDELIQRILDQIGQVIPGDARNLMLLEGDHVRVVNSMGYEQFGAGDPLLGLRLPVKAMPWLRDMRETGKPILIPDTNEYKGWRVLPELKWVRSYLGAPVIARGQLVGFLSVDSATPGFFSQEHARQLGAFASQAAIALENTQLVQETSQRAEQLATLHRIGLTISSALDLQGVLEALYDRIRQVMDANTFYVALYDESTGIVEFPMYVENGEQIEVEPRNIRDEPGITGHIIQTREPLHIPDLEAIPKEAPYHRIFVGEQITHSFLGVPLLFRGEVFGVLSIQSPGRDAYSAADTQLLATIATQASIAIQNARAYERLVETADELREIDRLKTQFLANMSHELRTPLNSIIGFSRVMLKGIDGPLTDLQETDLSSIYNSGQHLLSLINSILDMSKIEAGKIDLSFEEIDLSDTFKAVISTTRALVKDRPVELRSDLPDALPTVWADAQRVRQVLINLLSNASKFTNAGAITLAARADAEFVTISVADTGIGIDPEAQKRLFIPFQQVDGSTTRRAEGTGLGLAISRSFVEMLGGRIWVESEPGKGACFYFTLPVYQAVRQREEKDAGVQLEPGKKAVLAVDDDAGVISLLKRYLENDGYQVIGVVQAPHAMDMARRLAPHLSAITLDVVMPNMDGWQVLRSLKQDPQTRDIPVILCSIVDGLDQGLGMGASACLRKPVTRDEMLDALKKLERAA
jgi:signal transduction histidine kinase/CheY-like chemotaxis protein/HAMP domain-containing protein